MRMGGSMRWLLPATIAIVMLVGMGSAGGAPEPRKGGQIVVGLESEPPNLDIQWLSLNYIYYIAQHINERLFDVDEKAQTVPMLADKYSVSPDGRVYTITLRKGVKFHNGQEMTADDVVASVQRWLARSSIGRILAPNVTSIQKSGQYAVEIRMKEPMGFLITALGVIRQAAAIYPKSIIEAAGTSKPISEYIGTGPYRFVEWRKGQHVLLRRFDGYSPRSEAPSGPSGRRTAYADEIKFVFVPEPAVRAVGIQAGDLHFTMPIATDDYARLQADPNLDVFLSAPRMLLVLLNKAVGPTADVRVRRAIQAAVGSREILTGVFGDRKFWRLDPGTLWRETAWWTNVGTVTHLYNQANPSKAKRMLTEAGYNGEPLRMIVSTPERLVLNTSVILKPQLERAGMTVTRLDFDVATHRQVKTQPSRWEISVMDSTFRDHPVMLLHMNPDWDGWWRNAKKEALTKQLLAELNPDVALGIWRQIEQLYYEDVPIVKIGDFYDLIVTRKQLKGYVKWPDPFFWNTWLER